MLIPVIIFSPTDHCQVTNLKMGTIEIDGDFGYVILVVVAGWFFLQYLAFQVMKARKTYDVKVSAMRLKLFQYNFKT